MNFDRSAVTDRRYSFLQFAVFERMRFAEVGPIFPTGSQTGSHGILADIIPFLGIGLGTPQNVVEKALLPVRGFDGGLEKSF